jgi:HK97 family phage major capsid protein
MKIKSNKLGLLFLAPDTGAAGGGNLSNEAFQEKVLGGVKSLADQTDALTKNLSQLDSSTKSAFEDLTKKVNDSSADFEGRLAAVQKVQVQLAREQRMAFADPRERVSASPEKKAAIAAAVFRAAGRPVPGSIAKALGEDSSPGSTLISEELATDIYDVLLRFGSWSSLGVRNVSTKTTKLPVKTVRPTANFILTEGNQISDDTAKAGTTVTLEPEVIGVLLNVSRQLIDDADVDVSMDVMDDFVEALNFRLDFAAFQGSGASDASNGGITGLFNFGTAATAAAGNTSVETLDYEDVLRCLTTVAPTVLSRAARWWIHPTMFARMLAIKDANGRPIFLTANEAPSLGGIGTILGFPVTLVGAAPSTNSASAKVAAFGDPQSFAVGVRKDFEIATSDQFKWDTFQISFRGVGRAGAIGRAATGSAILTLPAA